MPDRKKHLSHEDRIVWEQVTRTVTPFSGRLPAPSLPESMAELLGTPEPPPGKPSRKNNVKAPEQQIVPPRAAREPGLGPIERPTWRKIKSGRVAIDGRLDLHGLKRAEAHNLLYGFLIQARQRGMRHVLVITGKGRSPSSEGVLRREVPQWLGKPEFRQLVSGLETSAQAHGGDGALYVRLRRQNDTRNLRP